MSENSDAAIVGPDGKVRCPLCGAPMVPRERDKSGRWWRCTRLECDHLCSSALVVYCEVCDARMNVRRDGRTVCTQCLDQVKYGKVVLCSICLMRRVRAKVEDGEKSICSRCRRQMRIGYGSAGRNRLDLKNEKCPRKKGE